MMSMSPAMSAMTARFGRCERVSAAAMPASAPTRLGCFRHAVQANADVRAASARARTGANDGLTATTSVALRAAKRNLLAFAERVAATPSMARRFALATPSTRCLGCSYYGIASTPASFRTTASALARSLGSRRVTMTPTGPFGMCLTAQASTPGSNHSSGGALLRRCAMLSALASSFCHWRLRRRRSRNPALIPSGA